MNSFHISFDVRVILNKRNNRWLGDWPIVLFKFRWIIINNFIYHSNASIANWADTLRMTQYFTFGQFSMPVKLAGNKFAKFYFFGFPSQLKILLRYFSVIECLNRLMRNNPETQTMYQKWSTIVETNNVRLVRCVTAYGIKIEETLAASKSPHRSVS